MTLEQWASKRAELGQAIAGLFTSLPFIKMPDIYKLTDMGTLAL